MPKIKCRCSNIISLGGIPCPHQYNIISDVKYDNFQGLIDAEELYKEMFVAIKCDVCKRIYVYRDSFNNEPEVYSKEL